MLLNRNKINQLLVTNPDAILTSIWLEKHGYSRQLVRHYVSHGWLRKLAHGAFIKLAERPSWADGVVALQQQLGFQVHIGGRSSFELQGMMHYLSLSQMRLITLYADRGERRKLPKWFTTAFLEVYYDASTLFNTAIGIESKEVGRCHLWVSSLERAVLELLSDIKTDTDYEYACQLTEGLILLRPSLMQQLLEDCQINKIKRLFLYLAHQYQLPVLDKLNVSKIDVGKGKYVIAGGGDYNSMYQLSVPLLNNTEINNVE